MRKPLTAPALATFLLVGATSYLLVTRNALADFTPPTMADSQTFLARMDVARIAGGGFSCMGVCRSAQTDGGAPQRCLLVEANIAPATFTSAKDSCYTALAADCTPQHVYQCASGSQQ